MKNKDLAFYISQIILEARLSSGLSQKQLAKKIGTKQPAVARWENGSQIPSISSLNKIAECLTKKLRLDL